MEINEKNKKLYEDAFVSDGTYSVCNSWKPSIDERCIEDFISDDDEKWVPATPLGYRDYKVSRLEGINNILSQSSCACKFTYEESHDIKRNDNLFKQYDMINIDDTDYVVSGDDEEKFFIINKDGNSFYINYLVE